MESNFTHEQSLTLINEMISRARNNVSMGGAYSLIYWGYMTAVLAIANSILWHILDNNGKSHYVWFAMIPAMAAGYFIERKSLREKVVKTHIDRIGGIVWAGFFISVIVFSIVIHVIAHTTGWWDILALNIPIIITMFGMGQFATASVFRYKLWYAFAAFSWAGAIVCAFSRIDVQLIVFAVCMMVGLAVPGHILNRQAKNNHV